MSSEALPGLVVDCCPVRWLSLCMETGSGIFELGSLSPKP